MTLQHITKSSHITLIVICVTLLASEAAAGGIYLSMRGLPGGPGLVLIVLNSAITGLLGVMAGRASVTPQPPMSSLPELPKL
jgi:hypothetical protein